MWARYNLRIFPFTLIFELIINYLRSDSICDKTLYFRDTVNFDNNSIQRQIIFSITENGQTKVLCCVERTANRSF